MTARHGGPPLGSAAREATAHPYVGLHRAQELDSLGADYVCPQCGPDPAGWEAHAERWHTWPPITTYDEPPDDPPRCLSCGHVEAGECGCTAAPGPATKGPPGV